MPDFEELLNRYSINYNAEESIFSIFFNNQTTTFDLCWSIPDEEENQENATIKKELIEHSCRLIMEIDNFIQSQKIDPIRDGNLLKYSNNRTLFEYLIKDQNEIIKVLGNNLLDSTDIEYYQVVDDIT